MSLEELSVAIADLEAVQEPEPTFLTDRHRHAVDQLNSAFAEQRPLAVMIGEGQSASSVVVQSFVAALSADVAVVRIDEPCSNATEFMGKVIEGVGFEPNDMSLEDLEGIFTMFLSFQKSHGHRTVLCIERAQEQDLWVLDKLRSLSEQEAKTGFGLMLIIMGQSGLKELLHSGPLSAVNALGGIRIILPPLTVAESKDFIRQRLDAAGKPGIDQLFQYQAINRIHELSKGVPDEVTALVNRCLETAAAEGISLITNELVQRAYACSRSTLFDNADTVNMQGFRPPEPRLVMQLTGDEVRELTLREGHTLIGRSTLCDVCIDSKTVSRRHALISYSSDGAVLVDLNSTNRTYVDGREIRRHELQPGETIELGGTKIEYVLEDYAYEPELAATRHVSH